MFGTVGAVAGEGPAVSSGITAHVPSSDGKAADVAPGLDGFAEVPADEPAAPQPMIVNRPALTPPNPSSLEHLPAVERDEVEDQAAMVLVDVVVGRVEAKRRRHPVGSRRRGLG